MSIINNLIINSIAFLPRKMVKLVADKYVAGQSSEDVLSKTKELNSKGYELTIDLLGEHVSDINESMMNHIGIKEHKETSNRISSEAITLIKDEQGLLPLSINANGLHITRS